jgi:hypothetical protein
LTAANIDELYDHPLHLGVTRTFAVPAKVPVRIVIWGERAPGGTFTEARLAEDLGAIVDDHIRRMGEAPFPHYTFVLMLAHDAYGGLEHRASSINLFHPHFAASRKAYDGLLELLSHELFHAWNGKRIAPRPLLEFDYTREAYTPCLWLMEGLTSHYDRFALRSSQRITAKSFLEKVLDDWARLMATPGRTRQSLEASSFDAWIKLYKPDESNLNTTVSYYLKGGLAMFALDLQIRRRTEGARSLDDVLRAIWQRYGAKGEPHPEDLQPVFEEASGLGLADVFERQIRGTADPELPEELKHVGLELRTSADPAQVCDGASALWLGATLTGTKVTGVFEGGPAHAAGLSPGDELIALGRSPTRRRTRGGPRVSSPSPRRAGAHARGGTTDAVRDRGPGGPRRGGRALPGVARGGPSGRPGACDDHDHGTVGMTLLHYVPMRVFLIAALLTSTAACRDKKSQDGLPPAQEWKADGTGAMVPMGGAGGGVPQPQPPPPPGMAMPNSGNPHAGANDPHAGLGIDPATAGAQGGGTDVSQLGLPAPDPNRPIDPSRYVKGVIKIHEKAKARAKAGTPMFIVVKRADASGQPSGTPLAVDKLTYADGAIPFELTEKQAMVAGTQLTGDVVVTVRYDQDGDALSKEAGDIVGEARVKLPADNVQVWLDTVL